MQTTEGLNLLNSLKHHNNGLALKSSEPGAHSGIKAGIFTQEGVAGFAEVLGITHGQTQRELFAPKAGIQIWNPGAQKDKAKESFLSEHFHSKSLQLSFVFTGHNDGLISFFCFQRHLYLREKSKLCKQPLLFAFCLKQGIPYYNVRNWFASRCSMKSVLGATLDYEQSSTQTLHNAPKIYKKL